MPPTQYDAVIIGGGHNGLIAAAYLGRAGYRVLVIEQRPVWGGASLSARVFPDYEAWLSRYAYLISLLSPHILSDLDIPFETRRRRIASCTPYLDAAGQAQALVLSNEDPDRSRASLRDLTGDDGEWRHYQEWCRLQQALAEIVWPSLWQPLATRDSFLTQLRTPLQKQAWEAFVEQPLGVALEQTLHHDLLRGLVFTDAKIGVLTHPHDPSLLQNRCYLYHVIGGGTGEWRVPVGGMRALVEALIHCGQTAGVEYRLGLTANQIRVDGQNGWVQATDSNGQAWQFDTRDVLVNAGPRTTARLLGQTWTPQSSDEGSVVKVNMLLRRLPRLRAAKVPAVDGFCGSLHLHEGYREMQTSYAVASSGRVPSPAPCEVYCHTLTDSSILSPELRQQGYQTLTLFGLDMPYRLFAEKSAVTGKEIWEVYRRSLEGICAESFADCLALDRHGEPCVEVKTARDLDQELDLPTGNIFHNAPSWFFAESASHVGQRGVETEFTNLWLAGSAAQRGGAVSGIPGYHAAHAILERDRKTKLGDR